MDSDTRTELERRRPKVPRYLFRAWNDTETQASYVSGGYEGLNTTDAITPLAFCDDEDEDSTVYDMSKAEFTDMIATHVGWEKRAGFKTKFSSWAASLSFVSSTVAKKWLGGASESKDALDGIHISIIDTKELWNSNEVFYVPSLQFLEPQLAQFDHEYLAYGVISGAAHKAVPLRVFVDAGICIERQWTPMLAGLDGMAVAISREDVSRAREVGNAYGQGFAPAVTLAVVCVVKRDAELFRDRVGEDILQLICFDLDGGDVDIPEEWSSDEAIQPDAEYVARFGEVEQMYRLMRALVERAREKGLRQGTAEKSDTEQNVQTQQDG